MNSISSRKVSYFLVCVATLLTTGCVSNPNFSSVRSAAADAFSDRSTWVPLLAAGVFAIGDYDEQTTEWASEENPIFGSDDGADNTSHILSAIPHISLTVSAMPSVQKYKEDGFRKSAELMYERMKPAIGAHLVNWAFTQSSKSFINRERPDGNGSESFPSGHTSYSVVSAMEAANLVDTMDISQAAKRNFRMMNYTSAGLSAWARLEANRHYPSDVLTSIAVGNFASKFINNLIERNMNSHSQALWFDTNGNSGFRLTYARAF